MTKEIQNRKGARKAQDIPQHVRELLNKGEIQTVNLTECQVQLDCPPVLHV